MILAAGLGSASEPAEGQARPLHVVFDFGGVLFRWRPALLVQRTLPHIARDAEAAAHWAAQIFRSYDGEWAEFDRGLLTQQQVVQRIARRTGLAEADVQRTVEAVPAELQPQPATVALLRRLHAHGDSSSQASRQRLYFLSNMAAPNAAMLDREHAFLRLFSDGVYSCDVHLIKPDHAIFALAARRFGQAPHSLVLLDDHLPNVHAARQAGWQALRFTDAAQAEAELIAMGCLPRAS